MRNFSLEELAMLFFRENNIKPTPKPGELVLTPITLNEDYAKKWNVYLTDFCVLTRDEKLIRETLYRKGGIGNFDYFRDKYFLLIKHKEAYYDKGITDYTKSDPKHLEGVWCILDKEGNEKVEFRPFASPYLIKDSCIYSLGENFYNIETGELYCKSYSKLESDEFLFLDNAYDNDIKKRGIMKINKETGKFELFAKK